MTEGRKRRQQDFIRLIPRKYNGPEAFLTQFGISINSFGNVGDDYYPFNLTLRIPPSENETLGRFMMYLKEKGFRKIEDNDPGKGENFKVIHKKENMGIIFSKNLEFIVITRSTIGTHMEGLRNLIDSYYLLEPFFKTEGKDLSKIDDYLNDVLKPETWKKKLRTFLKSVSIKIYGKI